MLTDPKVLLFGFLLLLLSILYRIQRVKQVWQAFGNIPAHSILVSPLDVLSRFLPRIPWITSGIEFSGKAIYECVFATSNSDILQIWSLFPCEAPELILADATATKSIFQSQVSFPKYFRDVDTKSFHKFAYGPSIILTEDNDWRKHRKIVGPSFSEGNNALVWESTVKITLEYFIKWNRDGKGDIVKVSDFTDVAKKIAFMVFSIAGFGTDVDWDWDKNEIPKGHTMPFMRALAAAVEGLPVLAAFPRWLLFFNKRGREVVRGHDEMEKYMLEMIEERNGSAASEGRRDLLTNLVHASMEKNSSQKEIKFTHQDLLGNIFILIIAGYESTASALSFSIALLATHQEEQEELYKHVRSVVPDGRLPTYRDVPRLTRVLAVINESLRLHPPVNVVKKAAEDCVIQTDSGKPLPVPKGTMLAPMANGIHRNPKYWHDPDEFRPDRFLGDYNKDAFIPFSAGARGCLGRRFAEIELIAVLSVIILHYKITVLEEPQYAHETASDRKKRVLAEEARIVLRPVRTPVMFTLREGANIITD